MTTLYKRHDVTTIAEVNALALSDNQENDSLVLGPSNETCSWILPYAIRNEPTTTGHWSYQDSYGGDQLRDGDEATVLVPIEARRQEPTDIFDPAFDAPPKQWSRRTHRYCTAWTEETP